MKQWSFIYDLESKRFPTIFIDKSVQFQMSNVNHYDIPLYRLVCIGILVMAYNNPI